MIRSQPGSGIGITELTGDVTATGPGSATATVAEVGGSTAADIHSAAVAVANASTTAVSNTLVLRDGSGNIAATNLSGTNTGDITIGTANGLSLVGQALSLAAAGSGTAGAVSAGTQTISGAKTFDTALTVTSTSATAFRVNSSGNKLTFDASGTNQGALGINIAPTGAPIHSQLADNSMHGMWLDGYSGASGTAPTNGITLRTARGTPSSQAAVKSGDQLAFFSTRAHDGTAFTTGSRGSISINAAQDWSSGANGTKITFNTTANAGATSATKMTLDNDGSLTVTGAISGSNLSGTNTGDITLATVGSSPANEGASLSGQVLTLQPADATHAGVVSTTTQTFAGTKTFSGTVALNGTANNAKSQISGAAAGTGISNILNGALVHGITVQQITTTAWTAAATTQDITLFTLKAKQRLVAIYVDTTVAYAGLAGTIQLQVGTTSGGTELILAHDVKTATVTKGLLDADLGASITRAALIQGGFIGSWSGTQDIFVRLTSGSGNIGTGSATNLTTGTTRFYVVTESLT